jgi:hypothetical protein
MSALIELLSEHTSDLINLLAIQDVSEPDIKGEGEEEKTLLGPIWWGFGFGYMWLDNYKSDSWRNYLNGKDAASLADMREEHIKRVEIGARLVMVDYFPLGWGYEVIADALERKDAVLDSEIPAAGQYIEIMGHRLYAGAVNGEESWALERLRERGFGRRGKLMSLWNCKGSFSYHKG